MKRAPRCPERSTTLDALLSEAPPPAERLVNFERWLYRVLAERLAWPADPAAAQRQIGQCRALVVQAVADLSRRGFLFRPRALAAVLEEQIGRIAAAQKAGQVRELYPYFRATWRGWVGARAEELREESMRLGTHISQIEAGVVTLPQIVEQSLGEAGLAQAARAARRRAREEARAEEGRRQLSLFSSQKPQRKI